MKILLLLPILFYVGILVFNLDSLLISNEISFFNFYQAEFPAFLFSSVFFVSYIILLFIIFDFSSFLSRRKINNLEDEIIALKSLLYDKREDVLKEFIVDYNNKFENFTNKQKELFEKFKAESEKDLLKQKAENDKILEKLNLIDKWIFDKIKESLKK